VKVVVIADKILVMLVRYAVFLSIRLHVIYICETQGQRREERKISVEICPDHPGLR